MATRSREEIRSRIRLQAHALRMRRLHNTSSSPDDWRSWLTTCFPSYFTADFAPHHETFWEHVWAIKPEVRPHPMIAVWPRGGAKSSSVETGTIALGVRGRKYALYVGGTQEQADKHVEAIGALFESRAFASRYPTFSNRLLGKYGHSRGWRRSRLTTQAGFTIDAAGLDTAVRGLKQEEARPDVIVFDDLDDILDSPATIAKKIKVLTHTILPAGASDVAIIGVQNLVHEDSIFSRLTDGRADFLLTRQVSGPIQAVEGLAYELRGGRYVITAGTPTWTGMDLSACQSLMNDDGISSFLTERQHQVEDDSQGMYGHIVWQHCRWDELPTLERIVVWVDPAVTSTDQSDCHGIQADGLGTDRRLYRLYSWEGRTSPEDAIGRAILKAIELKAECVGVETDQGGDTWGSTYREAARQLAISNPPTFRSAKAGAGHGPKAHRQAQMLAAYERGQVVHVQGTHETLELALRRFGVRKPYDLADAAYWAYFDLCGGRGMLPLDD